MAWNTPLTFVAGAKHTAAALNGGIRDCLKAIGDPWATTWVPHFGALTTDPTVGNGVVAGGFNQAGKRVHFWAEFTFGSTSTAGVGSWTLDLPVPEAAHRWLFGGSFRDASAGTTYRVAGERTASGLLQLRLDPVVAGDNMRNVTPTTPVTWATGDVIFVQGTYEAA